METIKLENRNIAAEIAALLAEVEDEAEADETDGAPLVPLRKKRSNAVSEPGPGDHRNSCFLTEIEDLEQEVFHEKKKPEDNSIVDFYLKGQTRTETMILSEEDSDSVSTEENVTKEPDQLNDIKDVVENQTDQSDCSTSVGLVQAIISELTEEASDEATDIIADEEMGQGLINEGQESQSSSVTLDNSSPEEEKKVGFAEENANTIENIGDGEESVVDSIEVEGNDEDPLNVELESGTEIEKSDSEEFSENQNILSVENYEETFVEKSDTTKISCIEDKLDETAEDQEVSNIETVDSQETHTKTNVENGQAESKIETQTKEIPDDPCPDQTRNEKIEVLPEGYPELLALTIAIFMALVIMFN